MDPVAAELVSNGLLGIATLVLGLVVRSLYRANGDLHKEYQEKLDTLNQKYMDDLVAQREANRALAENTNAVLSAILKLKKGNEDG